MIVLHTMPFEIDVMGSQRSRNVEGLAMQIHHWVQKVMVVQYEQAKVGKERVSFAFVLSSPLTPVTS